MREIKFRAWDKLDKTMDSAENTTYIENNRPSEFNEFVFMQYTGLKDKNGKEIYENDIIRLYEWEHVFEYTDRKVVFFQGCFKVEDMNDGYFCNIDLVNLLLCEVVGNIYENPELLKKLI